MNSVLSPIYMSGFTVVWMKPQEHNGGIGGLFFQFEESVTTWIWLQLCLLLTPTPLSAQWWVDVYIFIFL